MDRRGFWGAILALGVAPAVVKASSLMPVRAVGNRQEILDLVYRRLKAAGDAYEQAISRELYEQSADIEIYDQGVAAELSRITRGSFIPKLVQQVYNTSPMASALIGRQRDALGLN